MDVAYRIDKDILYIAIEGRIDASNAAEAEEKIFSIKKDNPGKHIVLDADKLEYISSAGLRVVLRLRKEDPQLVIINVAAYVYDVFDMTGFTDMVTIEKAYRRMSVEGCEFIATMMKLSSRPILQKMRSPRLSKNAKTQEKPLCWASIPPFPTVSCVWETTTERLRSF